MTAFLLICNPVDVWDLWAFLSEKPTAGYWCVNKSDFQASNKGDRLYLRVTSRDHSPGIHARFLLERRYKNHLPDNHWRPGKRPTEPHEMFQFEIAPGCILKRHISVDQLKKALPPMSRVIKVPQAFSTSIDDSEADLLDKLIFSR